MKKISVILLNYNGIKHLKRFLPIVVANTPSSLADIVVADNGSTDDSVAWIHENCPKVKVMEFNENYGFADGYNIAIGRVENPFVVLLNTDVEVGKFWLDPLYTYMTEHPKVVACQPKILQYAKKSHFEYAGAAGGYMDIFGYPFCRGRVFDKIEKDHGQYNDARPVFWATGACLMVRRVDFEDYGGFDSSFFAHQEEIDFCWRINSRGRQVAVVPESVVYHVGGGTLAKENPRKTYLNFRNNQFLLFKNLPISRYWFLFPFRFFLDYLASFVMLCQGKPRDAWAVVKARFAFWKYLPEMRKKRKENMAHTICYHLPCVYKGSILFSYHFLGKRKFSQLFPSQMVK